MARPLSTIVADLQAGYAAGKSLHDEDMLALAQEILGDRIDELANALVPQSIDQERSS